MKVPANMPRDPYEQPRIWTYGTLADLTSVDSLLIPAQSGMGNLSAVMSPGGPSASGGSGGPDVVTPVAVPTDVGGVGGETAAGGAPGGVVSGIGGGGGEMPGSADLAPSGGGGDVAAANPVETPGAQFGGSGEDSLPFTGFAAGAVSAVGAGLAAIGVALRRVVNRH